MRYRDLKWTVLDDPAAGEPEKSQRLRYGSEFNSPRIYVLRWEDTHTITMYGGGGGKDTYLRNLDRLDVAVRLQHMVEDERHHPRLSTME